MDDRSMMFIRSRDAISEMLARDLFELVIHQMNRVRSGELRFQQAVSMAGLLPREFLAIYRHCRLESDWLFRPHDPTRPALVPPARELMYARAD